MTLLADRLDASGYLLLDGAMGTELFRRGLSSGDSPEQWNLTRADAVTAVHADYLAAGSDIVLTNTFGGNAMRLRLHGLHEQVHEINLAGAHAARVAVDRCGRPALVAGSMGPTGELLVPLGTTTHDEMAEAFADQAAGLRAGGVDILWIETMSHLGEVDAAVEGCRRSAPDLPVIATLSFDTAGRSMMGVTAAELTSWAATSGVAGVGANCGANLADTEAAIRQALSTQTVPPADHTTPDRLVIAVKANAGIPVWAADALVYDGTPETMAAHAHRIRAAGARLIGGCCGSTPAHIAMMRGVLDGALDVPDVPVPTGPDRSISPSPRRANSRGGRRTRPRD